MGAGIARWSFAGRGEKDEELDASEELGLDSLRVDDAGDEARLRGSSTDLRRQRSGGATVWLSSGGNCGGGKQRMEEEGEGGGAAEGRGARLGLGLEGGSG